MQLFKGAHENITQKSNVCTRLYRKWTLFKCFIVFCCFQLRLVSASFYHWRDSHGSLPIQANVCLRLTLKLCLETFTFLMTGATHLMPDLLLKLVAECSSLGSRRFEREDNCPKYGYKNWAHRAHLLCLFLHRHSWKKVGSQDPGSFVFFRAKLGKILKVRKNTF